MIIQAIYQVLILVGFFFVLDQSSIFPSSWNDDERKVHALVFNTFVFCQLFNEFNCRRVEDEFNIFQGIHKCRLFYIIMIFTIVVQVLIIEFAGSVAQVHPLTILQWLVCVGIGAGSIPLGYIGRLLPTPRDKFESDDKGENKDVVVIITQEELDSLRRELRNAKNDLLARGGQA